MIKFLAASAVLWLVGTLPSTANPVVFWSPDSIEPGNIVLLYGGGLADASQIALNRLTDAPAAHPGENDSIAHPANPCPVIQP